MSKQQEPTERHDPIAALRVRNYRRFGAGFLVGSAGLQMMNTVVLWEIWIQTNDALMLGIAGLCRALPVVLLALISGHIADTKDRRAIVALTQLGFAITALGFAALSFYQASVWWFFVLLVGSACVRAFNGPARGSFLPLIVPDRIFHNVVTYQSGLFPAAAMGGPLVAGVLIAWLGPWHCLWAIYVLAAIGCLLFSAAVAATSPRPAPRNKRPLTLQSLLEGVAHMRRERPVFGAILLDLLAVLFGGATALLPIFATDILQAKESAPIVLGWLKAAPYMGALVMAIWLAFRPSFSRTGPVLLWSVAAYAVAIVVFGFSTNVWLSLAALAVSGAVDNVSVVIRHVLVQMRTPDDLRGRVGAVNSMFIECSNELGGFESGLVARLFGPVVSVVSGGIGTRVVVAGVAWAVPGLRKLGRVQPLEEPAAGPA
ncbi:MAG: MFS transporter [Phycisphaerae bacterium]|nr:MFS transporter [Phycisphaerae bacterium]